MQGPLLLAAVLAASAPKGVRSGKVVVNVKSKAPSKVVLLPSAEHEFKFGKLNVGAEYDWDECRYSPSKLTVGLKDSVETVPYATTLIITKPLSKLISAVASCKVGDDRVNVVVDSTGVIPKSLNAKHVVPEVGLTLEPSWAPRNRASPSRGLELKSRLDISGKRAYCLSKLAPKTRPALEFHFELDNEGRTRFALEPLLGEGGKLCKYTVTSDVKDLPCDQVSASYYDDVLAIKARLPVSLAKVGASGIIGALTPNLSVPLSDPRQAKFTIAQEFDI